MEKRISLSFDSEKDREILAILEIQGRKKKEYLVEAINFFEKYKNIDMENIQGVDPAFKTIALNLSMAFSGGVSLNTTTSIPAIQEPVKTEDRAIKEEVKKEEIYSGDPVEIDCFLDALAEHDLNSMSEQDY